MNRILEQDADIVELPGVSLKRVRVIVRDMKQRVDQQLNYLLDGLLDNVADALFEELHGVDEECALTRHFNIMRALKLHAKSYRSEFDLLSERAWAIMVGDETVPMLHEPRGDAEAMINDFDRRTSTHYKVLIKDLTLRLEVLLAGECADIPMSPRIILLNFWQSTSKLNLSYDERMLLLPLFYRFVMDRYGKVLAAANSTMLEHDIKASEL